MRGQQFCCIPKLLVFVVVCFLIYKVEAKTTSFNSTICNTNCNFWNNQYWTNGVPGNNDTVIIQTTSTLMQSPTIKMSNTPVNFTNFYSLTLSRANLEITNNISLSITHELNVNNFGTLNLTYVNLNIGTLIVDTYSMVMVRGDTNVSVAIVTVGNLNVTNSKLYVGRPVTKDGKFVYFKGGSLTVTGNTFFGADSFFSNVYGSVTFGNVKSSIKPKEKGHTMITLEPKKMDFVENVDMADTFFIFRDSTTTIKFHKNLYLQSKYAHYDLLDGFAIHGNSIITVSNDLTSSSMPIMVLGKNAGLNVGGKFEFTNGIIYFGAEGTNIVLTNNNTLYIDKRALLCGEGYIVGNVNVNEAQLGYCEVYTAVDYAIEVKGDVTFSNKTKYDTFVGRTYSKFKVRDNLYLNGRYSMINENNYSGTYNNVITAGKIHGTFSRILQRMRGRVELKYNVTRVDAVYTYYTPTPTPQIPTPEPYYHHPSDITDDGGILTQWYLWVGIGVGLILVIGGILGVVRVYRARQRKAEYEPLLTPQLKQNLI